jgi:hypothetical protein
MLLSQQPSTSLSNVASCSYSKWLDKNQSTIHKFPDCTACKAQVENDDNDKNNLMDETEKKNRIRKAAVTCVTCHHSLYGAVSSPLRMTHLCLSCNYETHGLSGNHPWKNHQGFQIDDAGNHDGRETKLMETFSRQSDVIHRDVVDPFLCHCQNCCPPPLTVDAPVSPTLETKMNNFLDEKIQEKIIQIKKSDDHGNEQKSDESLGLFCCCFYLLGLSNSNNKKVD